MSIDEAIELLKNCEYLTNREEKQIAELLEGYKRIKMLIPIEQALKAEYNKAIDDFVKFASDMPTVEEEDGEIRPMWLEEMAEHLKAGGENE